MIKQDEFTRQITLKAGLYAFNITSILSLLCSVFFKMSRKGIVEIDNDTMSLLLSIPWMGGFIFFSMYRWAKGASGAEREMANRSGKSFAFKNILLVSVLSSIAVSLFCYFFVFKRNFEVTLLVGFILLITVAAISYFTMGKVHNDE